MSQAPQQQAQPAPSARPAPRRLPLQIWGATDKGRQREGNEDSIYPHSGFESSSYVPSQTHVSQQGQLLIVADGVGGAQAGAQASQWAIRVAVEKYYELFGADRGADLGSAVEFANNSLYQYLQNTGTQEAGCTMSAAVIHENTLYTANVGDSRVYLIRNGKTVQQTRDHTLTQQKLDNQLITAEEAVTDAGRNVLTRSLGAGDTVKADVLPPLRLEDGDIVLVCSDGLTDMLEDADIARLAQSGAPKRAAQRLIEAANARGGYDNISVVLAYVGKKAAAGGVPAGKFFSKIRRMSPWQKVALVVGPLLIMIAFCAMIGAGFAMAGGVFKKKSTATPTPPAEVAPTKTSVPVNTDTPVPTLPSTAMPTPKDTATPRPTPESTPTRIPPTRTPVPTETQPPPPPPTEPSGGGGGGGGEKPTPKR